MKKTIRKTLESIGIAAGSVVVIGGLAALLAWTAPRASPDHFIRFREYNQGNYRVSVMHGTSITDLYFDSKGKKTAEHTYSQFGLINPDLDRAPKLADVTREASRDFPVGVEFNRMLSAARQYQKELRK